jgi:sulfatase modifying factor 1
MRAAGWFLLLLAPLLGGPVVGAPPAAPRRDRIVIPAGSFVQGSTHGDDDERPERHTTLPAFSIDRTEVTRADYARCVAARRCKPLPADAATQRA